MIAVTKLFISLIKNDCLSPLSHVPVVASMVCGRIFNSAQINSYLYGASYTLKNYSNSYMEGLHEIYLEFLAKIHLLLSSYNLHKKSTCFNITSTFSNIIPQIICNQIFCLKNQRLQNKDYYHHLFFQ